MSTPSDKRVIVVIGATGAQGLPVIRGLLQPTTDGGSSPYKVRALTRDPTHRRAKELEALGVELFQGSFLDFDVVARMMKGAYGAFVNTDGFTVGEMEETYAGIKIYEAAKAAGLRHFVYSSLAHARKLSGWKEIYQCDFFEGKARVADYLKSQPNEIDGSSGTMWSIICTGPYMDALNMLFAPIKQRPDGTFVFASPLADGHLPMVALEDIAFWARHVLDNPDANNTGVELEIASEMVTYDHIVETFKKVTGKNAEYKRLTIDEYFDLFASKDAPLASSAPGGTTNQQAFSGFWAAFRDDIVKRDMSKILQVHPNTMSLERWMRENKYDGSRSLLLKNHEDSRTKVVPNMEKIRAL